MDAHQIVNFINIILRQDYTLGQLHAALFLINAYDITGDDIQITIDNFGLRESEIFDKLLVYLISIVSSKREYIGDDDVFNYLYYNTDGTIRSSINKDVVESDDEEKNIAEVRFYEGLISKVNDIILYHDKKDSVIDRNETLITSSNIFNSLNKQYFGQEDKRKLICK